MVLSASITTGSGDIRYIDSYEDGTALDEYTVVDGDSANWEVLTESNLSFSAVDGTNILHLKSGFAKTDQRVISTSGLSNYFAKGNKAEIYVRSTGSNATKLLFGVADGSNFYEIRVKWGVDDLSLVSYTNGSSTRLQLNGSTPLPLDEWVKIIIVWDDGTLGGSDNDITVTAKRVADGTISGSVVANNSDHATSTGVGYGGKYHASGEESYLDKFWLT